MNVGTKWGRRYRLTIDPNDGQEEIIIELPFSVQFWVQRSIMSSLNTLSIDIYNLSPTTRSRLFQDKFNLNFKTIRLELGYGDLVTVFRGHVFESSSARNGTDIITHIESLDGYYDMGNSISKKTLSAGQTHGEVIKELASDFENTPLGYLGDFTEKLLRGVTLNGNTWDKIVTYSDNNAFIDNGEVIVMKKGEVRKGDKIVLDASTGLIETPRRDEGYLTITTLMEPNPNIKSVVSLNSEILPVYNGDYEVIGVNHQGMISNHVSGTVRSVFNLLTGSKTFTEVSHV